MRVRTAQLQNHAMEQMQEAEEIKKKKFMTKKFVGGVVALLVVVGIGLGVKFGLPYLE